MKRNPMKPALSKLLLALVLLLTAGIAGATKTASSEPDGPTPLVTPQPTPVPVVTDRVIRIGILLDTSNSMDGLIEQAKSQLWRIVSELGKARVDGETPRLEIAVYEYGNDGLDSRTGYIRQVAPLTTDLDRISADLFALRTNGGNEYCGHVIQTALTELDWGALQADYQMMVIAGNEPFTQGSVDFNQACGNAADRGLHINTIFCGSYDEGVATAWRDGATKGNGHYANIDHNEVQAYIATPYDDMIAELNTRLNKTYVAYGSKGSSFQSNQIAQDNNAKSYNKMVTTERSIAKSSAVYDNRSWDLVDATREGIVDMNKLDEKHLPTEMRNMTVQERSDYIKLKSKERKAIQEQIAALAKKREAFLAEHRKETGNTLGDALIALIRQQAEDKGFSFDS